MRTAIRLAHLHFHDLASHFLALSSGDRFFRFGWVMTDVEVAAYVESLFVLGDSVVPAANGHADRLDEFMGKITLADDSLRSQWNGVSPDASSLDFPESILS